MEQVVLLLLASVCTLTLADPVNVPLTLDNPVDFPTLTLANPDNVPLTLDNPVDFPTLTLANPVNAPLTLDSPVDFPTLALANPDNVLLTLANPVNVPLTLTNPVNVTKPDCVHKRFSFEHKLKVQAMFADQDGDRRITSEEMIKLAELHDANSDGVWTEQECVDMNVCVLGDTTLMAQFSCEQIFRYLFWYEVPIQEGGKINIEDLSDFVGNPTSNLITGRHGVRGAYEKFVNKKCLNRCIQREEKLNLMVNYVDLDRNGQITNDDIKGMLKSIDTDDDGMVWEDEYLDSWACRYGDSYAFVRFVWEDMGYNNEDAFPLGIIIDEINRSPISVKQFKTMHRFRYTRYDRANGAGSKCEDFQSDCTRQGLTPSQKVTFHQQRIDVSPRNGMLSEAEVAADLRSYWDTNRDDVLTERECVRGTECRYGDTTTVATQVCSTLLGMRPEKKLRDMTKELAGPMRDLRQFILKIYKDIETNKCTKRCLDDVEKANQEASDMDTDGDGQITHREAYYYVLENVDLNDDNSVTWQEVVHLFTCKYTSSIAQAHYRGKEFLKEINKSDQFPMTVEDYAQFPLYRYQKLIRKYSPNAALDRPCTEEIINDDGDDENSGGSSSSEEDDK